MKQIIYAPVESVKPYPGNPRINDKAVGPVAASIKEFGWQQPIVVDKDYVVIVGHTRLLAAKSLGMKEVPVVVAENLTPEQTKAYRLADNRTNQNADWDWSLLGDEFRALTQSDFDLSLTAFDQEEIKKALHFDERIKGVKSAPSERPDPLTHPGETWTSIDGEHVIHCGENNSPEAVQLLKKNPIDCIWTDPPYNLSLQSSKGKVHNDTFATDAEFTQFLKTCFEPAVSVLPPGCFVFTCGHHLSYAPTRDALCSLGLGLKQQLVWMKTAGAPNFTTVFAKNHECIWLFSKPGSRHLNATDKAVWEAPRELLKTHQQVQALTKNELVDYVAGLHQLLDVHHSTLEQDKFADHPTVKPSSLISQHLKRTTFPGDRVCDLFGGSGSTALTCFRLGRKSLTFELDPSYVDVTLIRLYEHHGVDFINQHGVKWSEIWEEEKLRRQEAEEATDED